MSIWRLASRSRSDDYGPVNGDDAERRGLIFVELDALVQERRRADTLAVGGHQADTNAAKLQLHEGRAVAWPQVESIGLRRVHIHGLTTSTITTLDIMSPRNAKTKYFAEATGRSCMYLYRFGLNQVVTTTVSESWSVLSYGQPPGHP